MARRDTVELPIVGMDCAECTQHVQQAIAGLPGVDSAQVFLSSEKAIVQFDAALVDVPAIGKAVAQAGHAIAATDTA